MWKGVRKGERHTKRQDVPRELDAPHVLATAAPLARNALDHVVEHTEHESDLPAARERQGRLVFAEINTALAIWVVEHYLRYAARRGH